MKRYVRRQLLLGALADCAGLLKWLSVAVFVLALLAMCPRAHAEEPAYWPPCGAADQDQRCPGQALPRCPDARMEVVWLVELDSVSWSCRYAPDVVMVLPRRPVTFVRVVDTSAAPAPHHPAELQCSP